MTEEENVPDEVGAKELASDDAGNGDDGIGRPIYLNPLLLASLGFTLLLGAVPGWSTVNFDEAAFIAVTAPSPEITRVSPPLPMLDEVAAAPTSFQEIRTIPNPSLDLALVMDVANGPLLVMGQDGRQSHVTNARSSELPADIPRIVIVIGGLGISRAGTQAAIQQLPGAVTLAFSPYAPNLEGWIAEAQAAGHEVILQLPVGSPSNIANDPNPHALLTHTAADESLRRLDWLLSRFSGYVGITNYMGPQFTVSPDALRPVLADLQARGLLFFDSRENPENVAAVVAAELEMPRVVNNRFLDLEASRIAVDARLLELERIAEITGAAVGIGYPYPVTIERIAAWIQTLEKKNVLVAPISAVARTDPAN